MLALCIPQLRYMGLAGHQDLGEKAQKELLEERPLAKESCFLGNRDKDLTELRLEQ